MMTSNRLARVATMRGYDTFQNVIYIDHRKFKIYIVNGNVNRF